MDKLRGARPLRLLLLLALLPALRGQGKCGKRHPAREAGGGPGGLPEGRAGVNLERGAARLPCGF